MSQWAEQTKKELAHIPVLPLDELRKLPEAQPFDAGVYFLWNADELVYIGKSSHIVNRANYQNQVNRCHKFHWSETAKPIKHDRLTALVVETGRYRSNGIEFKLQDLERAYIAAYLPRFNSDAQNGFT